MRGWRGRCRTAAGLALLGLLAAGALLLPRPAPAVEGDVVFQRKGGPPGRGDTPVAVFPHWFHRIWFKCYACHPAIFEMKAGANPVTMDAIFQGKFCGACHNGKVAWASSFENCSRCHPPR